MKPWYGVDLDGTLAEYGRFIAPDIIGKPILPMVNLVKKWLAEGKEVRIFTARTYPLSKPIYPGELLEVAFRDDRLNNAVKAAEAIRKWCLEHIGQELTITCVKDYGMVRLFDDRAVQVEHNTGRLLGVVESDK